MKDRMKICMGSSCVVLITSCASIPQETVILSKTVGNDLQVLQNSHRATVELLFDRMEKDINTFIDNVYAPYIIHSVLKSELENYQNGEHSLYGVIENAGKDKDSADKALNEMLSFTEFANKQINMKRNELLIPIQNQKRELLMSVDSSFRNVIYANATLTAHLESVHKVKEKQNKLLTNIGLGGLDDKVTSRLVELSEAVDKIVREGNTINTKSSEAKQNVENILNDIKELTNKVTE